MKLKNSFLVTDIAYLCMLLLFFVCILYLSNDPDDLQKNSIILTVVLAVVIITYFTSITAGLVMNIVLIFGYSIYVMVFAAYKGVAIDSSVYFWIFWSPCITASVYLFSRRTLMAEKKSSQMHEQLEYLSGVDAVTELKNMRGFEQECSVFMKISHRYNMELVLVVWQFRYQRELVQMVGAGELEKIVIQISRLITASLRQEDAVFMLDNSPYLWGTLLFTNLEALHIVISRVAKQLEQLEIKGASGKQLIALEMRVGTALYTKDIQSPFYFLEAAKKNSEYDV